MPTHPQVSAGSAVQARPPHTDRARPQASWHAITKPEWSARYSYRGPTHYDLRPGGKFAAKAAKQMRELACQIACASRWLYGVYAIGRFMVLLPGPRFVD